MLNKKSILKAAFSKIIILLPLLVVINVSKVKASIISYKKEPGSVVFTLDKGLMQVAVCKDDIIEVKYTIFDGFSNKASLVVNNNWRYPVFRLTENKKEYIIT